MMSEFWKRNTQELQVLEGYGSNAWGQGAREEAMCFAWRLFEWHWSLKALSPKEERYTRLFEQKLDSGTPGFCNFQWLWWRRENTRMAKDQALTELALSYQKTAQKTWEMFETAEDRKVRMLEVHGGVPVQWAFVTAYESICDGGAWKKDASEMPVDTSDSNLVL
jgi:hypothetical protein